VGLGIGLLCLGIFHGLTWGAFAAPGITGVSGASLLGGLLAAILGVAGAFAIAARVSNAIGSTSASRSVQVAPGITVLSAAAERARQIALCEDLVVGQRLISATDKASLTTECGTSWKLAEHQLPAAARRGALAYATAQCKQATSAAGLPARASSTLTAACGTATTTTGGTGLTTLQARLCREVVKAQVPAAAQARALAACPKPWSEAGR
jgi:hypothetical protein